MRALRASGNRFLLLILVSVIMQAVVQGAMTEDVGPNNSLVFSIMAFATAAVVFTGISRSRRPAGASVPAPRSARMKMVWMNVATAATFLSYYLSISVIPASTTSSIESALGPVALIVIILFVFGRREWRGRTDLVLITVLVSLGLLLAGRTWQLSDRAAGSMEAVAGLGLAAVAGTAMAVVVLLSRGFGDAVVSPVWVTAHRFHLTYCVAALAWLGNGAQLPDAAELLRLFVFGVFAVVIPLFLMQVGFQRADPLSAIAIIASLPGLTWLTQFAVGKTSDPASLLLITGVVLCSATVTMRQASPVAEGSSR